MILGVDEVGRGPWAGPLVVGAVVLDDNSTLEGLTDSKKLTAKKRQVLDVMIRESARGWGLGWVHAEEIDEIGLSAALRVATIRAVEAVTCPYHEIIIDGTINFLQETTKGKFVTTLPKADALIPAVSAASIIAKVARDAFMAEQTVLYPEYGFETHVGYGTAKHASALAKYGVTPIHRTSFKPIAAIVDRSKGTDLQSADLVNKTLVFSRAALTSKQTGDAFEDVVAEYLIKIGYQILERNWRTKYCEIDIIATLDNTMYFVEAKYRKSQLHGGGIAAVDTKKLAKMRRAAGAYVAAHQYTGDYALIVASSTDEANDPQLLFISE